MIGIYFSGTGNSKYCITRFLHEYDAQAQAISIEDPSVLSHIKQHKTIIIAYPIQYSCLPKIMYDFIREHQDVWKDKQIFILATMGLFSGDGCGVAARLLRKYNAHIIGGLHLKMPDSIADEKALKRSFDKNMELFKTADKNIKHAVEMMKKGTPTNDGLRFYHHIIGLFAQRLYFQHKTKSYSHKLKIDANTCIGCGICKNLCPMDNIQIKDGIAKGSDRCTMCYRCINACPNQAITLLGKHVVKQYRIDNYISS